MHAAMADVLVREARVAWPRTYNTVGTYATIVTDPKARQRREKKGGFLLKRLIVQ